jgi:galactokinase
MIEKLTREFKILFDEDPDGVFFSPGRVNLIGEHIDYNGGHVMPCAIDLGIWLAVSKNKDKMFRFQSLNFAGTAELRLQNSYSKSGKEWFNYPLGMIDQVLQSGNSLSGLNMLFCANLPVASGLSSSAAIESLMGYALHALFQLDISKVDLALLGKKVENEFIGVNCGIMDQFAVVFGEKDKAILLDCDSLDYEMLPFDLGNHLLVIINTNKPRTLADSKYNERFTECGAALKALKKEIVVNNLCEIEIQTFQEYRHLIQDPVLANRALHVISENFRVRQAAKALLNRDLLEFGQLMYGSHKSLKELYEVSGQELDTIVEFCKTFDLFIF